MKQIFVKDHGIVPEDSPETGLLLAKLLDTISLEQHAREDDAQEDLELVFESGIYHFYPDYASERLLYISNHEADTLKRVAFDLSGLSNLTLSGRGAAFRFHAPLIPFCIQDAQNIVLQDFTVDFPEPAYSEAKVIEAGADRYILEINPDKYPAFIADNMIWFPREDGVQRLLSWLEFDGERFAPAYNLGDVDFGHGGRQWGHLTVWTDLGNGRFEVRVREGQPPFPSGGSAGNRIILRHHDRTHPGIYVTDTDALTLRNVTVHQAAGMGLICERTANIELDRFNVALLPQDPRVFTTSADATHFVSCPGPIHIHDCLFENMLDDPINIHGIYLRIVKALNATTLLAEWVHHQHKGVPFGQPGQSFRIVDNETMLEAAAGTLRRIRPLNRSFVEITMANPLTAELIERLPGFVIENTAYNAPDVTLENNIFRNNRARGPLLTSAGRVVVRGNRFENAGAAILIEGDANYWFESGATTHILIEDNDFADCAYVTNWGHAPIQVSPGVIKQDGDARYHQLVEIIGNRFHVFDDRLVYARGLKTLRFKDNEIIRTRTFPALPGEAFDLDEGCELVQD